MYGKYKWTQGHTNDCIWTQPCVGYFFLSADRILSIPAGQSLSNTAISTIDDQFSWIENGALADHSEDLCVNGQLWHCDDGLKSALVHGRTSTSVEARTSRWADPHSKETHLISVIFFALKWNPNRKIQKAQLTTQPQNVKKKKWIILVLLSWNCLVPDRLNISVSKM
jgi:hypothetical protein